MQKWFRRLTRIEIVLIFLVIIAGSVVRMTGSGMGCPDWPKCFGHLIPPTERAQLDWQAETTFTKGQIIIVEEALYSAKAGFTTGAMYQAENWEKYTKHDYAIFNATHTWIEYINRLIGALSGLPMLVLLVMSLFLLKENWRYAALSAAGLFMLGFEAWLGKLVVDGNLIPGSITIHMFGALMIVAILLVLNALATHKKCADLKELPRFKTFGWIALVLTLIQVVLGTQVREAVDTLDQAGVARDLWMEQIPAIFYVHRSFSILILILNFWLWRQNRKFALGYWQWPWIFGILMAEIALGIILAYFDLPYFAQPMHLLLGAGLFALQLQSQLHGLLKGERRIVPIT